MAAPPTRLKPAQIARTSKIVRPLLDIRRPIGFVNAMEIIPQEVSASVLDRRIPRISLPLRRGSPIRRDNPGLDHFGQGRARGCPRDVGFPTHVPVGSVFRRDWVPGSARDPARVPAARAGEPDAGGARRLARPTGDRQHESWRRPWPAESGRDSDLRRAIGLLRGRSRTERSRDRSWERIGGERVRVPRAGKAAAWGPLVAAVGMSLWACAGPEAIAAQGPASQPSGAVARSPRHARPFGRTSCRDDGTAGRTG